MSDSPEQTRPAADPTEGTVSPTVARLGWVAAVLVPVWIAAGRFLAGTAGNLAVVYALTIVPLVLVLYVVSLAVPARRPAQRPSGRSMVALGLSWIAGLGLGLTLPDTGEGASSMVEAWAGPGASGVAAAFSNPLAIIMIFTAVVGCVLAVRDSRPGGRSRVTDEDEHQGTGHYPVWDV